MNTSDPKKSLLVATTNPGKIREIKALLSPKGIIVKPLHDIGPHLKKNPVENGKTFLENALIKARYFHKQTGKAVLADDSGLCVKALQGEPGIHSARYAGEMGDDRMNNERLLNELKKRGLKKARAFFCCVMVFIDSHGKEYSTTGQIDGEIVESPRGKNGFGYDPLFLPFPLRKTMAELSEMEKNEISHRAKALKKIVSIIIASI